MKKILYDIGANRGLYTDANMKDYDECVLVEANPELCSLLQEKYRGNPSIKIVQKIVTNKESEVFYISNADTISTVDTEWIQKSRFSNNYSWRPLENITCVSLDSLIEEHGEPTFIKIDVEGYEYAVVQSLHKKVMSLCFEWAEEKKDEILLTLQYLYNLGYTRFALQMEDNYNHKVSEEEWLTYEYIYSFMEMGCDPSRKQRWGMIWVS